MIVRKELKDRAKQVFAQHRMEFIAGYIVLVIASIVSNLPNTLSSGTSQFHYVVELFAGTPYVMDASTVGRDPGTALLTSLAAFALMIVLYPITVGFIRMALNGVDEIDGTAGGRKIELKELFAHFSHIARWAGVYILMTVKILLWTMLFVVPGIIAFINYSQTIYLMLDDPDLRASEAIKRSIEMMKGHRMEYFMLGLSFIPWLLLAMVTFGLAMLYVGPYMEITFAAFNRKLKEIHSQFPIESSSAIIS